MKKGFSVRVKSLGLTQLARAGFLWVVPQKVTYARFDICFGVGLRGLDWGQLSVCVRTVGSWSVYSGHKL